MRGDHAAMLWGLGMARRSAMAVHLVKGDPAWRVTIIREAPVIIAHLVATRRQFPPLP